MKNIFINGDSLDIIKNIDSNSIDCVILDPPYYNVINENWDKCFQNFSNYLEWFNEHLIEINRVCKMGCSIWLFGFNYQLGKILNLFEELNFSYKQTIVLDKGLKSVAGRSSMKLRQYPTATEYIYFIHKNTKDIIRDFLQEQKNKSGLTSTEINSEIGAAITGGGMWSTLAGLKQKTRNYPNKDTWNKLQKVLNFDDDYRDFAYYFKLQKGLTDVWSDINFTNRNRIHPTQKPYKLIERLIITSTLENYNVLDPFAGSGITAKVCKELNRNYICIEKDTEYWKKGVNFVNG